MSQVVIANPVINSPFVEPGRHFLFTDEGISNEIVEGRRPSAYFVPVPAAKKKGTKQLAFETEWTNDRLEENRLVNDIRARVGLWRMGGYSGVTPTTKRLLKYWTNPERERPLFFCQIEALETTIYLTEAARKYGDAWIENRLREGNDSSNPGLPRVAMKMATGAGKTVVMAMLIAWQTLNKLANPQDARFADTFLIITPGITIRDRLRVLMPNDPHNYYQERDIIPNYELERLTQANIHITNFHALQQREKISAGKLTKDILNPGDLEAFKETPGEMVNRVCRDLGKTKKSIVVINDEAHHCYRRRPATEQEKLVGEDRQEAEKRNEEARIWINGIEAIKEKLGVKTIFDLSATPFFLKGSGYSEGTLFPWVISDFSLIDAIEAGIVKVPRVPVADDSMTGEQPTYRDLWIRIREDLPKKGKKTETLGGEPKLPVELQGALHSLYGNYEKSFQRWQEREATQAAGLTPPVFIVVCNNTNVSKMVFDYVSGWKKPIGDQVLVQEGKLAHFRNDDGAGGWLHRPNTILVDSAQLDSGEAMSADFKKIASREIEEFKQEYRIRFPGRDAEDLTDEDLLREVMNTVGKKDRLGEQVRCVVSVSMLTEGWDANSVTHVLGVRAFGTQLLCEQVVGRALRRMSYTVNDEGMFDAEYAEVYGVPFSFIPANGGTRDPGPTKIPTRVRALESRLISEITFPRVTGYRFDIVGERLEATFDESSTLALSTHEIPSWTQTDPIIGESSLHTMDDLERRRPNEIAFRVARQVLESYFRDDEDEAQLKVWLYPQLLAITKRWMTECVVLKDSAIVQLLYLDTYRHDAADRVYSAIVTASAGTPALKPILRPYDTVGSTRYVDFNTTKPVYVTDASKCHISHVVADTDSWEQKMAQTIESMDEVVRYVKNQSLGFTIPYALEGSERQYTPDFILCVDDGHGPHDLLNLIVEVSGEGKKDKAAKVQAARTQWAPAINTHGGFGRWGFIEVTDPWDAMHTIRGYVGAKVGEVAA